MSAPGCRHAARLAAAERRRRRRAADRLLIRDGVVLTLDRRLGDFERGDVPSRGDDRGRRPHVPVRDAQVIDARA